MLQKRPGNYIYINGYVINILEPEFGPISNICILKAFPACGSWMEKFSDTLVIT